MNQKIVNDAFNRAWALREKLDAFAETEALRVFHGPGDGVGDLEKISIDQYGRHYWVTIWEQSALHPASKESIIDYYSGKGAHAIVALVRPAKGEPKAEPEVWYGSAPAQVEVKEGNSKFLIRFQKTRHSGLFLDHCDLRKWLTKNAKGMRVLNTFAYTGSLSVAAHQGQAQSVLTLDLSAPTIEWAKENHRINGFQIDEKKNRFVVGDVFSWLLRLKKSGELFDCIILDPPSFSRGEKLVFSTTKDLPHLHSLAIDLLAKDGILITSINSANVSWKQYEKDLVAATREKKTRFVVLKQISLPETFPTQLGDESARYLKGWILRGIS